MFTKATKHQAKLRLAICGVSGSGKTYSALEIAKHLGKTTALIDTEHGSASKYADLFDFDTAELSDHHPNKYIELIQEAGRAKYEVIIIDSLSHAWFWELNEVNRKKNSFQAWGSVRPLERALIEAMLSSPAHIIATMRTKTEWVIQETKGKDRSYMAPQRVGTAPIQASGIEFEFDLSGEMDLNHTLSISKSRCPDLADTTHHRPGEDIAEVLIDWLTDGAPMPESGQSKCDRVMTARTAAGLDKEDVVTLLETHFGRTSPKQLSSQDCDLLIEMINTLEEAS